MNDYPEPPAWVESVALVIAIVVATFWGYGVAILLGWLFGIDAWR